MLPRSQSRSASFAGNSKNIALAAALFVVFLLGYSVRGPAAPLPAVPATSTHSSSSHSTLSDQQQSHVQKESILHHQIPEGQVLSGAVAPSPHVIYKEIIKEIIKEVPAPAPMSLSQQCAAQSPIYERYKDFFDGCESIYLDFGTNTGVQLMKLFQPHYFSGAAILPHFDKYFGAETVRRSHVCAMGFEPNPNHKNRLKAIEKSYNNQGWRTYMATETGIGAEDGWLLFQSDGDMNNMEWGGKLIDAPSGVNENTPGAVKVASAVCIMEAVAARSVPAKLGVVPRIVMKIDIEGADESVLASMLRSGHLCNIEFIYVEHVSQDMADLFSRALQKAGCKTLVSIIDDESYHRSNFDLP